MSRKPDPSNRGSAAPAAVPARNSPPARVLGFLAYVVCFTRELVLANISMAKAVLFQKREDLAPGFVSYPLAGLSKIEVLMLASIRNGLEKPLLAWTR
jgi:multisubunit Na+/H+ antiporter MnhE subunit